MIKVGILRGPNLNAWDMQLYEKLKKFDILPIGITTVDHIYDISEISFPIRKVYSIGSVSRKILPLIRGTFTKFLGYDINAFQMYLVRFEKYIHDLDVLHSADTYYPFSYQSVRSGKPTIITGWENIPFLNELRPYSRFKDHVRKNASHFIAITEKAKKALEIEGIESERISVIPAGVDMERFKPTEKNQELLKDLNIPQNANVVLFVGKLIRRKGIIDLIYAIYNILKKNRDVYLLIVGDGPLKREILKLSQKLKINGNLRLMGSHKYSEMPKIHNLADMFCLPSVPTKNWQEQFGFALVEAMACGKPVVSTLSGSIPEVVANGRSGILVKPKDRVELANALDELILDENKRNRFGKNARKWVLEKFEAIKIAEKLAEVYRMVMP